MRCSASYRLSCALVVVVAAVALWPRAATAVPIRVRGAAVLRGHMRFDPDGWLELHGHLGDETRMPIDQGRVVIDGRGKLIAGEAAACPDLRVPLSRAGGADQIAVRTSALGEFCVRWRRAPDRGRIRLHFSGDAYHGSAELEVAYDRGAQQKLMTTLRFDPRPQVIDLDRDKAVLSATLTVTPTTAHAQRRGLAIDWLRGDGKVLGKARTSGDGRIHFEAATEAFGLPGHDELVVRFEGTQKLAASSDSQPVTLRASVPLRLAAPVRAAPVGEPARAVVVLEPRLGQVEDGVLEALHRGRSVGSAPVRDGRATLEIRLDVAELQGVDHAAVTLRYLPASPWWTAGPPLSVVVPIRAPALWGRVVWSILLAAVALWTLHSWRRRRHRAPARRGPSELRPGVHVVQTLDVEAQWRGTVRDAHEGCRLAGALIEVRVPSLSTAEDAGVLARCRSDRRGQFAFELDERPTAADLHASLPSHSSERRPLPAPGVLQINLLTRRRSVLRRFVRWARLRGAPYHATPDPTPGQVRGVADADEAPEVARWAGDVEAAAFGPDEVDESAENRLREAEPQGRKA